MSNVLAEQLSNALAQFSSLTRLYELAVGEGQTALDSSALLVEAFCAIDALQEVGTRDIIVLSTSAHVDLALLLGQPACLSVSLADGTRSHFAGDISEVAMLGSDGGRRHRWARPRAIEVYPFGKRIEPGSPDPRCRQ